MYLLYPQIEPGLIRLNSGLRVALLTDDAHLDEIYLRASRSPTTTSWRS